MTKREINKLIITSTESAENLYFRDVLKNDKRAGLPEIGCHFLVTRDGRVHKGRPSFKVGNSPYYAGVDALIIQLVGQGWDFNRSQLNSLFELEESLQRIHGQLGIYEYLPQPTSVNKKVSRGARRNG